MDALDAGHDCELIWGLHFRIEVVQGVGARQSGIKTMWEALELTVSCSRIDLQNFLNPTL